MNRQNTSNKMFGLVMIAVTLLLVACGGGDGDPTPTATSGANNAAPTLPADDGTAEILATEDISEEDITLLKPEIPATAEDSEGAGSPEASSPAAATATPTETVAAEATPPTDAGTPVPPVTDLTGDTDGDLSASTPPAAAATVGVSDASTPGTTETSQPATAEVVAEDNGDAVISTPDTSAEGEVAATPDATAEGDIAATPGSTEGTAPEGEQFNIAGDGTGGSGQPGEPSSNLPEDAPVASPVAGIAIEGCEVPNVPAFESEVTAYVTNAEVNFRAGPGTDCDQILEDPLTPDQAVEVIGGPVTQTSDNTVWLQIEVDGVPGWVSEDFVEPAE